MFRANALRQSIYSLNQRILDINTEINSIDSKRLTRQQRRDMRDARIQARLDLAHNKLGITLIDTLSPINKSSLFYKIQTEHACIDDRCSSLIKEAGRANYSVFIQQLEFNLSKGILTVPEDEALRTVIKLMKQHQEQEKRVANIEAQLNATIKTIRDDQFKRQQLAARLESLKGANPNLTRANEQLVLENRTLDSTRGQNNQSRDRLITPSLILAGSSLITSIPLILTLSGVIPVVLVPALFFSLLAFPPALLIIATLTVGIVALVYAIKSAINSSNIQKNEATIAQNTQQMQQNLREITELQTTTIPGLDVTIRTNQHAQTKLDESLQQATALSAQTLQQAKNTEPLGYAKAPFLLFANNLYPQLPTAPQYSPVKASAPPMDFDAEGSTPPAYSEEEASAPPAYSDLEPSAPPMEEVFGRKLA